MKVVLDTNVLLSAIVVPAGPSGQLLSALRAGTIDVVTTDHLWHELHTTLSYGRVQRFLEKHGAREKLPALLDELGRLIRPRRAVAPEQSWVKDDPKDDWVVQCAVSADADYIVSGDRHLRELGEVESIAVVTPAQMIALLDRTP